MNTTAWLRRVRGDKKALKRKRKFLVDHGLKAVLPGIRGGGFVEQADPAVRKLCQAAVGKESVLGGYLYLIFPVNPVFDAAGAMAVRLDQADQQPPVGPFGAEGACQQEGRIAPALPGGQLPAVPQG